MASVTDVKTEKSLSQEPLIVITHLLSETRIPELIVEYHL